MSSGKVKFFRLDKQSQSIRSEIDEAIDKVIASDQFVLGDEVRLFEMEFSEYTGTHYAVGVASGTDAITLALMAIGVSAGDEVITVANTAAPTVVAICRSGAFPVFVDIEENGFQMDPELIEECITDKTKAIVPVHLYGEPAPIKRILEIAEKHNIPVVEDACQAHGAHFNSKKVGAWGVMGCFSFYPTKNLGGFGDGGMIVLDDAKMYERLCLLRNYGQKSKYEHVEVGVNSRLDELQAAILRVKLKFIDKWNGERSDIARRYSDKISHPDVIKPICREGRASANHLYVVRSTVRDQLKKWLLDNGVETMIHYPMPLHLQPAFAFVKCKSGQLPYTEEHARVVMSLPNYPELSLQDVDMVSELINNFKASC